MSETFKQIAVGVVTSALVSFASAAFYAGQKDQQISENKTESQENKAEIAKIIPVLSKIPVLENRLNSTDKRLDTYESLVIRGQEKQQEIANQILDEMRGLRQDTSANKGEIGAIKTDIQWIKESIGN